MTEASDLKRLVDDALGLLSPLSEHPLLPDQTATAPLESLLAQCQNQVRQIQQRPKAPIRLIHHFACTGGTLIARALASQPNTLMLSEVDPLSTTLRGKVAFNPSDLIFQSFQNPEPPSSRMIIEMFRASLSVLHEGMEKEGRHVIVRDHSHSHFCTSVVPETRPKITEMLPVDADFRNILTVRHPLDSFLGLKRNGWARPPIQNISEYAERYMMFLDAHPEVPIFYYEAFVASPDQSCQRMCDALHLEYNPLWRDILPITKLSGDSGRSGTRIRPRPRRPVSRILMDTLQAGCPPYETLCERLGYDPDPAAPARAGERC